MSFSSFYITHILLAFMSMWQECSQNQGSDKHVKIGIIVQLLDMFLTGFLSLGQNFCSPFFPPKYTPKVYIGSI